MSGNSSEVCYTFFKETYSACWTINDFNMVPYMKDQPILSPTMKFGKKSASTWQMIITKWEKDNGVRTFAFRLLKMEENYMWDICEYLLYFKSKDGKLSGKFPSKVTVGTEDEEYATVWAEDEGYATLGTEDEAYATLGTEDKIEEASVERDTEMNKAEEIKEGNAADKFPRDIKDGEISEALIIEDEQEHKILGKIEKNDNETSGEKVKKVSAGYEELDKKVEAHMKMIKIAFKVYEETIQKILEAPSEVREKIEALAVIKKEGFEVLAILSNAEEAFVEIRERADKALVELENKSKELLKLKKKDEKLVDAIEEANGSISIPKNIHETSAEMQKNAFEALEDMEMKVDEALADMEKKIGNSVSIIIAKLVEVYGKRHEACLIFHNLHEIKDFFNTKSRCHNKLQPRARIIPGQSLFDAILDVKELVVICDITYIYSVQTTLDKQEKESETFLVSDLKRLYKSQKFSDIILHVGKSLFHVHSNILSARSYGFYNLLQTHMLGKKRKFKVKISESICEMMLWYMYTGEFPKNIDKDNCCKLYKAACIFGLLNLKMECMKVLKRLKEKQICYRRRRK